MARQILPPAAAHVRCRAQPFEIKRPLHQLQNGHATCLVSSPERNAGQGIAGKTTRKEKVMRNVNWIAIAIAPMLALSVLACSEDDEEVLTAFLVA